MKSSRQLLLCIVYKGYIIYLEKLEYLPRDGLNLLKQFF